MKSALLIPLAIFATVDGAIPALFRRDDENSTSSRTITRTETRTRTRLTSISSRTETRTRTGIETRTRTMDDEDEHEGNRTRSRHRDFSREHASKFRYELLSIQRNGDETQGVDFLVSTVPIPRFVTRLIEKVGRGEDSDRARYSVGAGLYRLIEFNSTIPPTQSRSFVPFHRMRPDNWTSIEDGVSTVVDGNSTTKVVTSSLTFHDDERFGNLNFTVQAEISTSLRQVQDLFVTPSDVKYSVFIENFNYKYENSQLMLVTALWARNATATQFGNNAIVLGPEDGAFFWSPSYTADGVEKFFTNETELIQGTFYGQKQEFELPENESKESSAEGKIITFVFDRAEKIAWDPQVGLASEDPEAEILGGNVVVVEETTTMDIGPTTSATESESSSSSVSGTPTEVPGSQKAETKSDASTVQQSMLGMATALITMAFLF
jgi:hypothetical protein